MAILAAQDDLAPSQIMPDVMARAFVMTSSISVSVMPSKRAMPAALPQPALTDPQ